MINKETNLLNHPSKISQKIELYFRDTKHAQIADLFIEYKGEILLVWKNNK